MPFHIYEIGSQRRTTKQQTYHYYNRIILARENGGKRKKNMILLKTREKRGDILCRPSLYFSFSTREDVKMSGKGFSGKKRKEE